MRDIVPQKNRQKPDVVVHYFGQGGKIIYQTGLFPQF